MKTNLLPLFLLGIISINAQLANKTLVVPEFNNHRVRTYKATSTTTIAPMPSYDINFNTLSNPTLHNAFPNSVAMYDNDLFVAVTWDGSGATPDKSIVRFPNYGVNPAAAISGVTIANDNSNDYVGIAFDSSGNLYASEGSYLDTHIVKYTRASNYNGNTGRLDLGNGGLTSYFSNITFDNSGNLWASDYKNNRIIAIKASDLSTASATFHNLNTVSWGVNGSSANNNNPLKTDKINQAFAEPEGVAFDSSGNLWVANNNDSGTNVDPTLVKITTGLQSTILGTTNTSASPALTSNANGYKVWNIPSSGSGRAQLGGMQIDKILNRIYVNEEISGSGMWFDIASLSNIVNTFSNYKLNITSTNPGNGGIYLASNSEVLSTATSANNLKEAKIFPNPVDDQINIISAEKVLSYKIYSAEGKLVKEASNINNSISVSTLGKGNYVLVLKGKEKTNTLKFIKK